MKKGSIIRVYKLYNDFVVSKNFSHDLSGDVSGHKKIV